MEFKATDPLMITAMASYSENEQYNLINLLANLREKKRLAEVRRYLPFAFLAPEKFRLVARWGDEDFKFYKALQAWNQPADEKVAKKEFLALRKEHNGKILAFPFWVEIKPMNVSVPRYPHPLQPAPVVVVPPPAEEAVVAPPPAEEAEEAEEAEDDASSVASSESSESDASSASEESADGDAPADAPTKCDKIMPAGARKGEVCGRPVKEGTTKCGFHSK